jgi:hypothetical protein
MKAPNPPIPTIGRRKSLSVSIGRLSPIHQQSFIIVSHRNRSSTIIWHHDDMPDDHNPLMPRREPERIDLAAIKTDLEFLIQRVSNLPTR